METDVKKIDKNMAIDTNKYKDVKYYDLKSDKFYIFNMEDIDNFTKFSKKDTEERVKHISKGVEWGSKCSAGVQLHFKTNSEAIYIKAKLDYKHSMDNLGALAESGFDVYKYNEEKNRYEFYGVSRIDIASDIVDIKMISFTNTLDKNLIINFPLYCGVQSVEVGFTPESYVEKNTLYDISKKIVFYGTSITQGASASRPGLATTNSLSRELKIPVLNYGYSGSAMGEKTMFDLISEISADAFVLDYEANAYELMYSTLEYGVDKIRKENNNAYIIVCSMLPQLVDKIYKETKDLRDKRRRFMKKFVKDRNSQGDNKIIFFDGVSVFNENYNDLLIDGAHPNDLGFELVKNKFLKLFKKIKI